MKGMKLGAKALFIVILSGMIATSALACTLWMGLMSPGNMSQGDMPCSNLPAREKCPHSICLASSPYVAADSGVHVPHLQQVGPVVVDPSPMWASLQRFEPTWSDDNSPPGPMSPLFLRTHSLLI